MESLTEALAGISVAAITDPEGLSCYSVDGCCPEVAVFPSDVDTVSRVLSTANSDGKKVTPWGGGTQMSLGNPPSGLDLVIGMDRLNRVLFHEPGDLVASFEAGISLETLNRELARVGQTLPLEAPMPSKATIGGILAANHSGPFRLSNGVPRDWLIGIKVVHSDGTITKSGGRVVKNVTGYDLNKLYTGSFGTLGVIVEATFKLAPLPSEKQTLTGIYPSMSAALDAASGLLGQSFVPHGLQVVNHEVMARLPGKLLGLTSSGEQDAAVIALLAGRRTAVARKVKDSLLVMEQDSILPVEILSWKEGDIVWQAITDLGWSTEDAPDLVAKVSVLPSQVKSLLAEAPRWSGTEFSWGIVADLDAGIVRLMVWLHDDPRSVSAIVERTINMLRQEVNNYKGHVVVERCPAEVKQNIDVWGDTAEGFHIMRRIKDQLDPVGILNPGRFVGGI